MRKSFFGLLVSVLLLASSAFAVGPFERYVGVYKLQNPPKIVKNNILYCNYLNIKLMTGLVIGTLNGNETAEVISITNGGASTQHSYITFFEYSYPNERYPRSGVLSEEGDTAMYTVDATVDKYHWVMSKGSNGYQLEINYYNSYGNRFGSCHYYLDLQKVK